MTEPLFDAVCVGAHPDDVEIGMGGTAAGMCRRGLKVAIVDLTDGEPTPKGSREVRAAESSEAARLLGVAERRTLTLPNRYLFDSAEARTELAETLRELRPRMLFIPYPHDAHPDHVAAAAICLAARFYSKFTKTDMAGEPFYPPRVFHYMAVHLRTIAEPTFMVDITTDLGTKMRALAAYRSQFVDNERNSGIMPAMERAARMWGSLCGTEAAEPFFALEPIAIANVEDIL